jgi:RNA polymerase sigma-70 factor (ECF subfamily)
MRDDRELVRLALAGREDAYREIVERYQRPVYGLLLRMVRDPAQAEDLAQEAFVKAFSALPRYDPSHRLASWLFKIAHNAAIDHLRRRPPPTLSLTAGSSEEPDLARLLPDPKEAGPERAAVRSDLARDLERALLRLRPEYREVMVLRFGEGLAYEEIAAVTRLPLGTVKTHIHRARKEMAVLLRQGGWAPEGSRRETASEPES